MTQELLLFMLVNLPLAAGLSQGWGAVGGAIQLIGYVAAGGTLISAGLAAVGERSLGSLKIALILAGVAAAAFVLAQYMFNAFGSNINLPLQTPN